MHVGDSGKSTASSNVAKCYRLVISNGCWDIGWARKHHAFRIYSVRAEARRTRAYAKSVEVTLHRVVDVFVVDQLHFARVKIRIQLVRCQNIGAGWEAALFNLLDCRLVLVQHFKLELELPFVLSSHLDRVSFIQAAHRLSDSQNIAERDIEIAEVELLLVRTKLQLVRGYVKITIQAALTLLNPEFALKHFVDITKVASRLS